MTPPDRLPRRSEIPPEDRWDLESVFSDDAAWKVAARALTARLPELALYRGQLGESAAALLAALRLRDELVGELERLEVYAHARFREDATEPAYVTLRERVEGLNAQVAAAQAWVEPELAALDAAALDAWLAADAGLAVYGHYLATVRRNAARLRSAEAEELLATLGEPLLTFRSVYYALTDGDLRPRAITDERGRSVPLELNDRFRFLMSADRAVRRDAWEAYHDAFLARRHTLAANYAGEVKRHVVLARARGYASALDAALAPQAVPRAVVDTLLEVVWRNFPVWQRYFRLQARLLGVERTHGWDLSEMPIYAAKGERRYGFPEAAELVLAALEPLGADYVAVARRGIVQRWVDPYPNVGKRGGAYSTGARGTHPFLSLNWTGNLAIVSVLAHELGHSLHSYYSWETQPLRYAYASDIVGESVSNLHQALLTDYLLERGDEPAMQHALLEERIGSNLRYLFHMPLLARFELECHARVERGAALTADDMCASMLDLFRQGYSDAVALDAERAGIAWATYPHLFTPFYVYQYGVGTAAAARLARAIRAEGAPAAERFVAMLRAGASVDPLDALLTAGVDARDPATIQAAFDQLAGYIARLEALATARS